MDETTQNGSTAIALVTTTGRHGILPAQDLRQTADEAREFMSKAKAASTTLAYDSDWANFAMWCRSHGLEPLPAAEATVVLYITSLARPPALRPATIRRRLTAISQKHLEARLPNPSLVSTNAALKATLQGICKVLTTRQDAKTAIMRDGIVRILDTLEDDLKSIRNRALVLVGFASAMRRSEIASVETTHLKWSQDGVTILIPRSKTDQTGDGREVEVIYGKRADTCPVRALKAWLKAAGIKSGPVFRKVLKSGRAGAARMNPASIGVIVKKLAFDAALGDASEFAGHSLRAGYVTQASDNGATFDQIMKQTGHQSVEMVYRYSRSASRARKEAAAKLGL
jgi:integrase